MVCQQCGNLRSVCADPAIDWHPQESVCWATATREWGIRRLKAKHKDFDYERRDANGEIAMSPLDGRSVWVSDMDLEALGAAQESHGDKGEAADAEQ